MEFFTSLSESLSLSSVLGIGLTLALAWLAAMLMRRLLDALGKRFNRYRLQIVRLDPVFRLIIWITAVGMIVFGILHLPETAVLAALATIGVAVGIAAQDMLRNVLAGVVMVFDRPFRVGDMVRIGEHYGEVVKIDLNLTKLRTFTDDIVTVPNAEVMRQSVVNANAGELTEMIPIAFDLPANTDVAEIKSLARTAAIACPYTYLKKPIVVAVEDRVDYQMWTRFTIKAYVIDVRFERLMASDIMERVKTALRARKLTMTAPALNQTQGS